MTLPAPAGRRRRDPAEVSTWRKGFVTATAPLRVRLEGEDAAADGTPSSISAVALAVGDKVWCQLHGRRRDGSRQLIVHGKFQ